MVDLDEQLRNYSSWLAELADRHADVHAEPSAVVDPTPIAPRHKRRWWPLAAVAAVSALIVGLVAVTATGDSQVPADEPSSPISTPATTPATTIDDDAEVSPATTVPAPSTTPSTSAPTTVPTTIGPEAEVGWSGGLLDDLDPASLRPLDSYTEGDVIIPTGPTGWRVQDTGWTGDDPDTADWHVDVTEARPNNEFGQYLYLLMSRTQYCGNSLGCQPSGRSVTIDGVVWEEIVVERIPDNDPEFVDMTTLRAQVGDRWVSLAAGSPQLLNGPLLDNPPIIEYLEGLRVGSPDVLAAIGEACWQCGVAGAEGDPFAAIGTSAGTPTTTSDDGQTANSAPSDVDSDIGRPLTELATGDVLVPTYVPPGLTLRSPARIHIHGDGTSQFWVYLENAVGDVNSADLWDFGRPLVPHTSAELNDLNHPPVDVAGLTWVWNDFDSGRYAYSGSFSVSVSLHGFDRSEAERFIEGLRAVPTDEYPGPIAVGGADGTSVINPIDPSGADAEVVASDDQFELTAVQVEDQVCIRLIQTSTPTTMFFSTNCWDTQMVLDRGIVELISLDEADTQQLIVGVVDSPDATTVRVTSPDGNSVVAPTGPANQAIDGRFFLARLDLDVSDGIRLDRFTIEDASR